MLQALAGYEQTGAGICGPTIWRCSRMCMEGSDGKPKRCKDWTRRKPQWKQTTSAGGRLSFIGLRGKSTLKQQFSERPQSESEKIAEAYFDKARRVASVQGAKSLELRAVTSLGRLWMKQGKIAEAKRMLGETYGWFGEGFDLPDLRAAKILLEG